MIENYDSLIKLADDFLKERENKDHEIEIKLGDTFEKCGNCVDGIDGETCGDITYAGVCSECNGSGFIKKNKKRS